MLSSAGNQHLITALRAARSAHIKPTSMLLRTQPTEPWSSVDFALLHALQILEDETCGQCGNPIWLCRSADRELHFKVTQSTCYATKAIKEKEFSSMSKKERQNISDTEKKTWGVGQSATPELLKVATRKYLPTRTEFYQNKVN